MIHASENDSAECGTHTKMHQGNRIDGAKRESASNAIAYLVFVYGNKLPIVYACLC